jgi:hypothetical protein
MLRNPLAYLRTTPGQRKFCGRQPEKHEGGSIIGRTAAFQQPNMSPPGAGCLECKAVTGTDEFIQPVNHHSTSRNRTAFGIERGEAASNLVSVHNSRILRISGSRRIAHVVLPAPFGPPMTTTSFLSIVPPIAISA